MPDSEPGARSGDLALLRIATCEDGMLDETHEPGRRSWIDSANGHEHFPLQNLPIGVFAHGDAPRGGIAIGDRILDLEACAEAGLFRGKALAAARAACAPALNAFMAMGPESRISLRRRVFALLDAAAPERSRLSRSLDRLIPLAAECTFRLPALVGDYSDFFAGIYHAVNAGRRLRPGSPLSANYKFVPIGYHGRASSLRTSGCNVRRPAGQRLDESSESPVFGPTRQLDYECELAIWLGPGNALGEPIPVAQAARHIVGLGLLNDWSARDLQRWEAQPLGPFLAKSFLTSVSPWVVTLEALEPFRSPQPTRPPGDPRPLPYLWSDDDQARGAFDVQLEVTLTTARMKDAGLSPCTVSRSSALDLYWTVAQLLAHQTSNGCNVNPGDLLGSGTISAADPGGAGCLLELTEGGQRAVQLPGGEQRRYLEAGDEVVMSARCRRPGYTPLGFGELRATIVD